MWEELVPSLEKKFDVVVFDNRGACRSGATPPPSSSLPERMTSPPLYIVLRN